MLFSEKGPQVFFVLIVPPEIQVPAQHIGDIGQAVLVVGLIVVDSDNRFAAWRFGFREGIQLFGQGYRDCGSLRFFFLLHPPHADHGLIHVAVEDHAGMVAGLPDVLALHIQAIFGIGFFRGHAVDDRDF